MSLPLHRYLIAALLLTSPLPTAIAADPSTEGWVLTAEGRSVYHAPTMANGMIGVTVSSTPMGAPSTLLNGLFDKFGADNVQGLVPTLEGLSFDISVDGNESPDLRLDHWVQSLNMQDSVIRTHFELDSRVRFDHTLRALRHLPFNILQTLEIGAIEPATIRIRNAISVPKELKETRVWNKLYKRDHVQIPVLAAVAETPTGKHRVAIANTYAYDDAGAELSFVQAEGSQPQAVLEISLREGETFSLSMITALSSTAHVQDPANEAERLAVFALLQGTEDLIRTHELRWHELWTSDIQIAGDLRTQRDVRFALYNLYSYARADQDYSLAPMGLSNLEYYGHIFWDCELWMFPSLLVLQPDLARSLLDYRFNRLDAARRNAQSHGFEGAMFPWESDDLGEESTPIWALTGPFEHHITAVVGLAFWNYYQVTQDRAWLETKGFPVLENVARFWQSRVSKSATAGYDILNVVGADEYAENVDNNAFTNGAVATVLRNATSAASVLGMDPNPDWLEIANNLKIETFEDGTTREYKNYDGRIVKQADVNLLAYPLQVVQGDENIRRDLDYYLSRIDPDGPAMTHSVLSVIASQLGESELAWELFQRSYLPNRREPYGTISESPNLDNVYFATAAGGMLQAVLFGFAGLEIGPSGITQSTPSLPNHWQSVTVTGVGPERRTIKIEN